MDIIKLMRESNVELMKTQHDDLLKWKNLDHSKQGLECFLNYNIAQLQYLTKDGKKASIVCSSNTTLIKLMNLKRKSTKEKILTLESNGIHTYDSLSVTTWDLIENKFKTVYLIHWSIVNFISIFPENMMMLDEIIKNILKKKK